MPLIKVQTSVSIADTTIEALLRQLSASLAKHTDKPEAYVMTVYESGAMMTFGGTAEPTCYVEIKSVGSMSSAQTKTMSQDFCQQIQQALNIPANRTYIEFADAKGSMWGWNGTTL